MPGIAPATMSMIPDGQEPLGEALHAVVVEVLEQGVVRGDRACVDGAGRQRRPGVGAALAELGGTGGVQHLAGVAEARRSRRTRC